MRARAYSAVLVLVLSGCASAPRLPDAPLHLVWPPPPEPARIGLASEFRGPDDLGIGLGFLRRLSDLVFGAQDLRFRRPYAVAVWGDGRDGGPARIAVSDIDAACVHLLDLDRDRYERIDTLGDDEQFASPVGVSFDRDGRLYVVDSVKRVLVRYSADGELDRVLARDLSRPAGVAVDGVAGVIYVADVCRRAVLRFDLGGRPLPALTVAMQCPTHLAVDGTGRLLVSDPLGFQVLVISRKGEVLGRIGSPGETSGDLSRPKGVGADRAGNIYVVDALFDNVQIFDLEGQFLLPFGSAGDQPGEFALPAGLTIDARDLIYVADPWNGRVQVFRALKVEEPR